MSFLTMHFFFFLKNCSCLHTREELYTPVIVEQSFLHWIFVGGWSFLISYITFIQVRIAFKSINLTHLKNL